MQTVLSHPESLKGSDEYISPDGVSLQGYYSFDNLLFGICETKKTNTFNP